MPAVRSLKVWAVALLAAAALVLGTELFLRYSTHDSLKLVSLALTFAGILILGGTRWRGREVAAKLLALLLLSGHLLEATQRYPGLLKEPQPHSMAELLGFGGKVFVFGATAILAVGVARLVVVAIMAKRADPAGHSRMAR